MIRMLDWGLLMLMRWMVFVEKDGGWLASWLAGA